VDECKPLTDGSGELDMQEFTKLARALVPGGDEAKVGPPARSGQGPVK